jgi:hypothetical protein
MKVISNLMTLASTARPQPGVDIGATPAEVVQTENKWRLLRYRPDGAPDPTGAPVLLSPARASSSSSPRRGTRCTSSTGGRPATRTAT